MCVSVCKCVSVCMCMCKCACDRETERQRERESERGSARERERCRPTKVQASRQQHSTPRHATPRRATPCRNVLVVSSESFDDRAAVPVHQVRREHEDPFDGHVQLFALSSSPNSNATVHRRPPSCNERTKGRTHTCARTPTHTTRTRTHTRTRTRARANAYAPATTASLRPSHPPLSASR